MCLLTRWCHYVIELQGQLTIVKVRVEGNLQACHEHEHIDLYGKVH